MLAAEALRLAAMEVLCPTASKQSDTGWPTLARHRVFDSAAILPDDLEAGMPFTPCLSLYTEDVRVERRGDTAPSTIGYVTAVLAVIAELATATADEDGTLFAAPIAEDDARARLILGALGAQVRRALVHSEAGQLFRTVAGSIEEFRVEPFTLPQFDLRFLRSTLRFTCRIRDDKFSDAPGLPEPLKSLAEALPEDSYAAAKLGELGAAFAAQVRTPLDGVAFSTTGDPAEMPDGQI